MGEEELEKEYLNLPLKDGQTESGHTEIWRTGIPGRRD